MAEAISCDCLSLRQRERSRPICFAHSSYFAAGSALGWKERGWLRHTSFTSPLYVSRIFCTVGSARWQKGHWKSENSTMVTLALFAPVQGESVPRSTLRACARSEERRVGKECR